MKLLIRLLQVGVTSLALLCSTWPAGHAGRTWAQPVSGPKETVPVVDCIGRHVSVPARVERIACLYAFAAHVVVMLDRGKNIVAVSKGPKRDVLLNRLCPEIGNALVPKSQGNVNIEELLLAKPDIVFVPGDIGRNTSELQKMEIFQLPVLTVDYKDITGQQRAIEMIGEAIGAREQAEAYNRYYGRCIDRVREGVSNILPDKRVRAYHATVEATRTYGEQSLAAEWMRLCGVVNVAVDQSLSLHQAEKHAGLEQILLWNPEVIFTNEPRVAETMAQDLKWSSIRAVQQKKIYQMPIGISRWGHPGSLETPLAMLWAVKTVYPNLFAGMDMKNEVEKFYREFFRLELTDALYGQMLSGKGMRKPKRKK
ncbi:MAG: ABC transporter substrate-binding protein [Deltaproteobacteria bacterium]|nr:ABC transporter substrate-binding protein [Deltaproteobacteria bacterium]